MAQSPQKPPEPSISEEAYEHMTDDQRREEQQRRSQPKSSPQEGTSENQYPGTGSPS